MRSIAHRLFGALTLFVVTLSATSTAATAAPLDGQDPPPKKTVKVTWPKLGSGAKRKCALQLRKLADEDEEVRDAAQAALVDLGAQIAPTLLRRLANNDATLHEPIARVLDAIVVADHAPLLLELADRKQLPLRRYVIRRLATFRAAEAKSVLAAAAAEEDEQLRFYGALGLAGLGDASHFDTVVSVASEEWRDRVDEFATVLTGARSDETAEWVFDRLRPDAEKTAIACLRLARYLVPKAHAGRLTPYLDSPQNAIKKAAINALRVVVDGDEPLEKLSVFQVIEECKKWRGRL